jgi:drug/metabolite transporter (DMT)-like permease
MPNLGRHADRAIYVLIAVLAVSVALQDTSGSAGAALAAVAGTAIALTLAELFAGWVGISIREHRAPTGDEINDEHRAAITGLVVATLPTFFFLLAVLDVMRLDRAYIVAQWTGFGVIGVYTYVAARHRGGGQARSLLSGLALALLGGMLILLNSLLK